MEQPRSIGRKRVIMISLCIPTYRRPEPLAVLLESILLQDSLTPDIEVVISDDANCVRTAQVAEDYIRRGLNIRFHSQATNLGLDDNYRFLVENASGEYVWFCGDDDRLRPGALSVVKERLLRGDGLVGLTLGSMNFDRNLIHLTGVPVALPTGKVHGRRELFLRLVESLGFMSTLVVQRKAWRDAQLHPAVRSSDNLYSQVLTIGLAVGPAGSWDTIPFPCIDYRSDNDQFVGELGGWLQRMMRDAQAYHHLFSILFPDDPGLVFLLDDRILRSHIRYRVQNAKLAAVGAGGFRTAAVDLWPVYSKHAFYWTFIVPMLFAPSTLVRLGRHVQRRRGRLSVRASSARANG